MSVNAICSNCVRTSEIDYAKQAQNSNVNAGANNTSLLKQDAPSDSFTLTSMEKPKAMESIGNGILMNIKQFVPIWGTYSVGDLAHKREAVMKEIDNPEGYNINDSEKGGFAKFGKGLLEKIGYSLPIYGTYKLGKDAIETEQAYNAVLNGEDTSQIKKPGFFKCLGKGIVRTIAYSIPVVSAHTKGKDIEKINQLYDEMKAQEANQ